MRGVAGELRRAGLPLRGAHLTISSTLPRGGGLSSSAALEVALCLALLAGSDTPPPEPLALARSGSLRHSPCGGCRRSSRSSRWLAATSDAPDGGCAAADFCAVAGTRSGAAVGWPLAGFGTLALVFARGSQATRYSVALAVAAVAGGSTIALGALIPFGFVLSVVPVIAPAELA